MSTTTYSSSIASVHHPLPSGFNAHHTADDVLKGIDLTGKNIIVTGGYSGIGLDSVRVFAAAGARVFVPARDISRAQAAVKDFAGTIEVGSLDLADPKSIDAFVQGFLAKNIPLHILLNNAGITVDNHELDTRGLEKHFAVNHIGHFQLTVGLLPALRAAKGARVVLTGSAAHRISPVVFEDIHYTKREWNAFAAYGQSKTANSLFAFELDKREAQNGIRAFSVHPGTIVTNIIQDPARWAAFGLIDAQGNKIINPDKGQKTTAQGASTQVFAATSPLLNNLGGAYLEDNDIVPLVPIAPLNIQAYTKGVHAYAIDDNDAKRLWELSEQILVSAQ